MTKRLLIDARQTEETRVITSTNDKIDDFEYEVHSRRQLKSNIYLARVTRVEPSLQAAFIEYGGKYDQLYIEPTIINFRENKIEFHCYYYNLDLSNYSLPKAANIHYHNLMEVEDYPKFIKDLFNKYKNMTYKQVQELDEVA